MKREAISCFVLTVLFLVSVLPMRVSLGVTNSQRAGPSGAPNTGATVDWWPMFHHDLTHTGYSTSTAPTTNQTLWSYKTGLVESSPAVSGGVVYVGSGDDYVYALNVTTGALVWRYQTGGYVSSSPAVSGGVVYVGSGDDYVYALNVTTGALVWRYQTGGWVESSPAVSGGVVYAGSDDWYVYALNAATGALVWRYQTGDHVASSPAVSGGVVYVGSDDDYVYALDAATGALLWRYLTGGHVGSSPAVSGLSEGGILYGVVFVGSADDYVYALDADTGTLVWRYLTGSVVYCSPAVSAGVVYVGSWDTYVYALNAATGTLVWRYATNRMVYSSPAVSGGVVFVGSDDDYMYALNAASGTLLWSYKTGGYVSSSPAVSGGLVYVGSWDGYVYALGGYSATIESWDVEGWIPEPITMDGSPTGYSTPHTFALNGTHTFTVPSTDILGYTFNRWSTGETSITITVTSGGTYTAEYRPAVLAVRGVDNRIYYRLFIGGWWDSWNVVPAGATCDSPAAAILGDSLFMVVRGMDQSSLWYGSIELDSKAFSGWTLLSGATHSAPTLTSNGTALCLVVRGLDDRIYLCCYIGGGWGSWHVLSKGATLDGPAAALVGDNLRLFVRGMDGNSLWYVQVTCDGTFISDWTLNPGATDKKPTLGKVPTTGGTVLCLTVKGMDNQIYVQAGAPWVALPGATIDGPAATGSTGYKLHIFVRGMDGNTLWYGYYNTYYQSFSGWTLLDGATPSAPTLTS